MSGEWLRWAEARPRAGWQGVERLELELLPAGSPAAARLYVHLLEAPVTPPALQLAGGRRLRDIAWRVVEVAAEVVTLELAAIGDHSTYTVTLLDGGGFPVDPFFASADFVFTIDCERGDCRPPAAEADRGVKQRPAVDLMTKDYAGFVGLLGDHVRVSNPRWADLSPASLERALLELVSHHGDMLSYYQDRVANEAFLDEASQRYSLRQHGKLLGYDLFDGSAAETVLAFSAGTSGYVPEGAEVTTPAFGDAVKVAFHVTERARVRADHSALAL
ncbi:MAG TPA: hypothetical protein VFS00_26440, partial [Polyangiaceae bacterium]|nr:hypothetical protein [Polyangiaceae bacterium]